jgi:hypothetical protein
MDDLFKTVNIVDSRIQQIKSSIPFGVLSGAAQNTYQSFGAISQSTSTITYNIQVPSMSTLIDRNVLQQATVTLRITCADVPEGDKCMDYGNTDSLQAFPLNSLITTQTATINNTSVTTNLQDILAPLLRMCDNETLERYNSLTPSMPDKFWKNYANATGTNSNPLAALNEAGFDVDYMPRGAYPVSMVCTHYITGGGTDDSFYSTDEDDTWVILLTFTVVEPILGLSPFAHTCSNSDAAFMGLNNLSLTFNLDNACKRVFSSATGYINGMTVNSVAGAQILLNFLSLQPEQYSKLQARNVLPYLDINRYIYNQNVVLPASPEAGPIRGPTSFTFSNIQLNQIPELMILLVRKPMAQQNWDDSSSFYTINGISVNFNNCSGILSSASQQQLFLMSMKNGSSESFYEFMGHAQDNNSAFNEGQPVYIPTLGSMLVLNPSVDFGLPSMLSGSSGGQYNFQATLQISNQTATDVTPEIVLICVNSGLFVTESGTSMIHTGILTSQQVLETKNQPAHMDTSFYKRIIGGAMHNIQSLGHMISHRKEEEGAGACAGAMSAGQEDKKRVHRFKR